MASKIWRANDEVASAVAATSLGAALKRIRADRGKRGLIFSVEIASLAVADGNVFLRNGLVNDLGQDLARLSADSGRRLSRKNAQ